MTFHPHDSSPAAGGGETGHGGPGALLPARRREEGCQDAGEGPLRTQDSGLRTPLVVDAHTHAFWPNVVASRERYLARDRWFGDLYANPRARLVVAEELLASMDAAGIEQAVVCGFPWRDLDLCREHNDYLAEACRGSERRLAWLATVPPGDGPAAVQEAERAFGLGAAGLGELNADAQAFDLLRPKGVAEVMEFCTVQARPVMLHASEPVGHAYSGKGTATPDRLVTFLTTYPNLRVVLAHWGGGLPFYELMPEVAAAANVVYDSAASTYLYRFEVFRAVLDVIGPERVLFASDYPVLRQERFLRRVLASGLRPEELPAVMGANARRVYGLAEPPAVDQRRDG